MENSSNVVGAPLEQESVSSKSLLDGMGGEYVVEVYNPLSNDFRVKFARSVTGSPQMTVQEMEHMRKMAEYGIPLKKDGGAAVAHSSQYLTIPAGATIKLPGDVAQVAVRQLVNYILMQRNKGTSTYLLADPYARAQMEREVVVNHKLFMNDLNEDPTAEIERKIAELNRPDNHQEEVSQRVEQSFPTETGEPAQTPPATDSSSDPAPRRGRPVGSKNRSKTEK